VWASVRECSSTACSFSVADPLDQHAFPIKGRVKADGASGAGLVRGEVEAGDEELDLCVQRRRRVVEARLENAAVAQFDLDARHVGRSDAKDRGF
jgi:hypothetical protein